MRVVVQRVSEASVKVEDKLVSNINIGLLVLAAWETEEIEEELDWMASKIANLRIFNDTSQLMNLSVKDIDGDILLVSQFTLHASTRKGNRPSFIRAARPEKAMEFYKSFHSKLEIHLDKKIPTGIFGADMKITLVNDGPVTIIIDSKLKE